MGGLGVMDHAPLGSIQLFKNLAVDIARRMRENAMIDADDPFDQMRDQAEIVRDGHDGHLAAELLEQVEQPALAQGIDIGRGLVQQQNLRLAAQGAGD